MKEKSYPQVEVRLDQVDAKNVVRMRNYFKVSYKAMLKQLVQLRFCDARLYDTLLNYQSVENADEKGLHYWKDTLQT